MALNAVVVATTLSSSPARAATTIPSNHARAAITSHSKEKEAATSHHAAAITPSHHARGATIIHSNRARAAAATSPRNNGARAAIPHGLQVTALRRTMAARHRSSSHQEQTIQTGKGQSHRLRRNRSSRWYRRLINICIAADSQITLAGLRHFCWPRFNNSDKAGFGLHLF